MSAYLGFVVSFIIHLRPGPLTAAVLPYVWYSVTSAAIERTFSLAALVDATNRQRMALRPTAVTMFCNGDAERRLSKR